MRKHVVFDVDILSPSPEDEFQDLLDEGYSVSEALKILLEMEISSQWLRTNYPNWTPTETHFHNNGCVECELEPIFMLN